MKSVNIVASKKQSGQEREKTPQETMIEKIEKSRVSKAKHIRTIVIIFTPVDMLKSSIGYYITSWNWIIKGITKVGMIENTS